MRTLGCKQRGEEVPAINLVLAARLRLKQRILQHALEHDRLFGHLRLSPCLIPLQPFLVLVKELLEFLFQGIDVSATMMDNVARRLVIEQRE